MAIFNKDKKGKKKEEEIAAEANAQNTAAEEAPKISMTKGGQETPVQEKKPGANARQFTGPQAELMKKIESIAKAMYEGKRDCYLILDPRTTLEELEKGERLRPMISPLNQQRPLPVIRIATGSIVAEQVARNYNCVSGDTALVAKIPFANIFTLLNNLMIPGIFGFVVYEGGKEYVGSTVHMCSYVISELLQKDAKPYLDQGPGHPGAAQHPRLQEQVLYDRVGRLHQRGCPDRQVPSCLYRPERPCGLPRLRRQVGCGEHGFQDLPEADAGGDEHQPDAG